MVSTHTHMRTAFFDRVSCVKAPCTLGAMAVVPARFSVATARIATWCTTLLILCALGVHRASRRVIIPPIAPCHFARRYPYCITHSLLLCCSFYALGSTSRLASCANLPYRSLSFCATLPSFLLIYRSFDVLSFNIAVLRLGDPAFSALVPSSAERSHAIAPPTASVCVFSVPLPQRTNADVCRPGSALPSARQAVMTQVSTRQHLYGSAADIAVTADRARHRHSARRPTALAPATTSEFARSSHGVRARSFRSSIRMRSLPSQRPCTLIAATPPDSGVTHVSFRFFPPFFPTIARARLCFPHRAFYSLFAIASRHHTPHILSCLSFSLTTAPVLRTLAIFMVMAPLYIRPRDSTRSPLLLLSRFAPIAPSSARSCCALLCAPPFSRRSTHVCSVPTPAPALPLRRLILLFPLPVARYSACAPSFVALVFAAAPACASLPSVSCTFECALATVFPVINLPLRLRNASLRRHCAFRTRTSGSLCSSSAKCVYYEAVPLANSSGRCLTPSFSALVPLQVFCNALSRYVLGPFRLSTAAHAPRSLPLPLPRARAVAPVPHPAPSRASPNPPRISVLHEAEDNLLRTLGRAERTPAMHTACTFLHMLIAKRLLINSQSLIHAEGLSAQFLSQGTLAPVAAGSDVKRAYSTASPMHTAY
ncbi:hypothetical protein C8J57DRAFT_1645223 [Mycena rebaudengoi]|nr:hypothetical protein C8J57DRAFT_1645223 [Mycena rebaudengoi]